MSDAQNNGKDSEEPLHGAPSDLPDKVKQLPWLLYSGGLKRRDDVNVAKLVFLLTTLSQGTTAWT